MSKTFKWCSECTNDHNVCFVPLSIQWFSVICISSLSLFVFKPYHRNEDTCRERDVRNQCHVFRLALTQVTCRRVLTSLKYVLWCNSCQLRWYVRSWIHIGFQTFVSQRYESRPVDIISSWKTLRNLFMSINTIVKRPCNKIYIYKDK